MKQDIHPTYEAINVQCSCGNQFTIRSTTGKDLNLDICAKCHPFYTGKQKMIDTAGRIDAFNKRFARKKSKNTAEQTESDDAK